MEIPIDLRRPSLPFVVRPEPPAEGESVQVLWYSVSRQTCTCCKPGLLRYFVRNIRGEVLSMATGEDGWADLCHVLGWYPKDGLQLGDKIRKTATPVATKAKPPWPGARRPVRDKLEEAAAACGVPDEVLLTRPSANPPSQEELAAAKGQPVLDVEAREIDVQSVATMPPEEKPSGRTKKKDERTLSLFGDD